MKLTQESAVLEVHVPALGLQLDGVQDGVGGDQAGVAHHVEQLGHGHEGQAHGLQDGRGVRALVVLRPLAHRLEDVDLLGAERVPQDQVSHRHLPAGHSHSLLLLSGFTQVYSLKNP